MRILPLSVILLALITPSCTERTSESLVATGTTAAPGGEVMTQPGIDAAGSATSCLLGGSDDGDMALPKQRRPKPTRDDLVIRNCRLVRDAAEAWAAESDGDYPGDPESRNTSGHTLIDFLPGGMYLVNPFDGTRSQPLYLAWGNPGDTEYLGFGDDCCEPFCDPNGYMITGFGESGEIFRFTQNWPDSLPGAGFTDHRELSHGPKCGGAIRRREQRGVSVDLSAVTLWPQAQRFLSR